MAKRKRHRLPIAGRFFSPWEKLVNGWQSAVELIDEVADTATQNRKLAWRGVISTGMPLHSSIYRRILRQQLDPTESNVAALEQQILDNARRRWRFDQLPALEIFAQIQHLGGSTRLLDVSLNPFVALWFAVEEQHDEQGNLLPERDGRLFAFDVTNREIELDGFWGGRQLPWSKESRQSFGEPSTDCLDDWSVSLPRLWRPPSYNDRIPAQNAAFLIGGVPQMKAGQNTWYRKRPGFSETWKAAEVRRATSVTLRMNQLGIALRDGEQRRSTPTFTLRITRQGKKEIRDHLSRNMGLDPWTIYPDILGLSKLAINIH